jgi:hypothetical protein
MWENRLLYMGIDLQDALDKAQQDINTINANLTAWKGRPISLQSSPDINTALPEIEGEISYCNIIKPLDYWIENGNAMAGVDNFYVEAIYSTDWDLPHE